MLDSSKKLFRWGPIDSALLPLAYPMLASFDMMHELFGICWPESLIIYDHDKALWILENDAVGSTGQSFMEKVILPDRERQRFYKVWDERAEKLSGIEKEIEKADLEKMSDSELGGLVKRWNAAYLAFWAVGMTAELANYPLEARLKNLLKPYFEDERDLNEAFATLSTPDEMSFYKKEESELIEVVLSKDRDKALAAHASEYFWIYNNYLEAKVLGEDYFAGEIAHTTAEDAQAFLREMKDYKERVTKDKAEIVEKLGLSEDERKSVLLLNDFIIFQDVRKRYHLIATHWLEVLLGEISRRCGISVRDLKWLLPDEMKNAARGEEVSDTVEARKHLTVFSIKKGKTESFVRNKASKIEKEFNKADFEKSVNLQGTVACTGKHRYFRGVAKVVQSPKEGEKLKAGEILVTTMTTPDYVACIKRAGAIITDIGGVTCHAAVVSREYGIPCIVGTENATKVIKDGDILELHNLRGTVKIVEG